MAFRQEIKKKDFKRLFKCYRLIEMLVCKCEVKVCMISRFLLPDFWLPVIVCCIKMTSFSNHKISCSSVTQDTVGAKFVTLTFDTAEVILYCVSCDRRFNSES